MKRVYLILGLLFFISGCSVPEPAILGNKDDGLKTTIALSDMANSCQRVLPITHKKHFGKVKLLSVVIQDGDGKLPLSVSASFFMKSFEIPEGIAGLVRYDGTLSYDPNTRILYFSNLQARNINFKANPSVISYVSSSARRNIPILIKSDLSKIPLYQMGMTFQGHSLQWIKVQRGNLILKFR